MKCEYENNVYLDVCLPLLTAAAFHVLCRSRSSHRSDLLPRSGPNRPAAGHLEGKKFFGLTDIAFWHF